MALIKCPECGREVSSRAQACPQCGCPIAAAKTSGPVAIRISKNIQNAIVKICVIDSSGNCLGEAKMGGVIRFELEKPTRIKIVARNLLTDKTHYEGEIKPNKRYEVAFQPGGFSIHYTLNEIDVIDSE